MLSAFGFVRGFDCFVSLRFFCARSALVFSAVAVVSLVLGFFARVRRWFFPRRGGFVGLICFPVPGVVLVRGAVDHVQMHSGGRSPFQFTWRVGAFSALSPIALLRTQRANRPVFGDPEIPIWERRPRVVLV